MVWSTKDVAPIYHRASAYMHKYTYKGTKTVSKLSDVETWKETSTK